METMLPDSTLLAETYLRQRQGICPYCNASRPALVNMMLDRTETITDAFTGRKCNVESENHATAMAMLKSCHYCRDAVYEYFKKL